jgi:hypothetical protein
MKAEPVSVASARKLKNLVEKLRWRVSRQYI